MILYITPKQQSKHRAQSQASWASSKNRVRPDTNIYPSPSECPPAYLIVPPLLSYVPQILVAQIMMYAFSLPMIYSDFCRLCRRPPAPPSLLLLYKRWVVLKFQQLCLLLNCPLQQNTVWGTKVFFIFWNFSPQMLCVTMGYSLECCSWELLWSHASQLLLLPVF